MQNMSPIDWILRPLKKYAQFSGRAPRAEYWWYAVTLGIAGFVINATESAITGPVYGDYGIASLLMIAALMVPTLAVTVRRLHDIGRTGWWALARVWGYLFVLSGVSSTKLGSLATQLPTLAVVALFGLYFASALLLLVFMLTRGTTGQNAYGPDPYGPDPLETVFV